MYIMMYNNYMIYPLAMTNINNTIRTFTSSPNGLSPIETVNNNNKNLVTDSREN